MFDLRYFFLYPVLIQHIRIHTWYKICISGGTTVETVIPWQCYYGVIISVCVWGGGGGYGAEAHKPVCTPRGITW